MATLQANGAQLILDGTDVSGWATSVKIGREVGEEDVSAGFGTEHKSYGSKLKDTPITMVIAYDVTQIATTIPLVNTGIHTMTWRPEGNTGGKPEHVQSIHITKVDQTAIEVDKPAVMLEVTAKGTGAPTKDMWAGGTV